MKSILLSACLVPAAFAQPSAPPGPYTGQMMVRVTTTTQAQLDQVYDHVTCVWSCRMGVGEIDVQVTPAQKASLEAMGLPVEVRIPDVQAVIDAERRQIDEAHLNRDAAWFLTYRTLAEIHAKLDEYAASFPALATTFVAGSSLEGRPLKGVRITGPDQPGNPRATRPAVLFHGCQHAREWATPMTNMWIADQLVERYATDAGIRAIADACEVIVIPVVNPDGYEYTWLPNNRMWRKNRRDNGNGTFGVDTNRNWGQGWGGEGASTNPGNDTYRGTGPFSEPETQVMRDFVLANPRIKAHIDFHSYSQLILTPWGSTIQLPPEHTLFAEIGADMQDAIGGVHGMFYRPGPIYTNIYPASGGACDWTYGGAGVLGTSIEVRDTGQTGFLLPPEQIIPNSEENFAGAMALIEHALRPLWWSLPNPLPEFVSASGAQVAVNVRSGSRTLAGPPTLLVSVNAGAFEPSPTAGPDGLAYTGALPGLTCADRLRYYFEATTTDGQVARFPAGAPAEAFAASGPPEAFVTFADDMESDRGWTVGAPGDNATLGLWERADPQPTAAQPGDDHSDPGVLCFVTGAAAGSGVGANDVDGGTTTLTSPVFSALPPRFLVVRETRVSYARWYSNNAGSNPNSDTMPVEVSRDGGATWQLLESVSENAGAWVVRSFRLEDFGGPTGSMRLRFLARDLGAGSVVEAALDDVRVEVVGCVPDTDLNHDGVGDQDDVAYLIGVIAGAENPTGIDPDFNQDGIADQQDILDLITVLAGG